MKLLKRDLVLAAVHKVFVVRYYTYADVVALILIMLALHRGYGPVELVVYFCIYAIASPIISHVVRKYI